MCKWVNIFRKTPPAKLPGGPHDCGLRALCRVMPELPLEKITHAFDNSCDKWPFDGITNKEFNIALRFLGVFELFKYSDTEGKKLIEFLNEDGVYILLIYGHFTVVMDGKIKDSSYYQNMSGSEKVFCSWKLL